MENPTSGEIGKVLSKLEEQEEAENYIRSLRDEANMSAPGGCVFSELSKVLTELDAKVLFPQKAKLKAEAIHRRLQETTQ